MSNYSEIFNPQSIAVVGASNNPNSSGYRFTICQMDYGYQGRIYPVNPRYAEVLRMPCYACIKDIPDTVDYVISAVSAPLVPAMLEECGQKKVKVVHLFTGRFSETGRPEAANLEREILAIAKRHGIRIIGPNCMGLYKPRLGISFSDAMPHETTGTLGLISQSGQAAEEIVRTASLMGLNFSNAISYGNALDLNECDYVQYLSEDPDTEMILMYLEGLREGRRFFDVLKKTTAHKPVIILKGGRGESGTRAVASHTASMAGSTLMLESILAQAGAVFADNMEEFIDIAVTFHYAPPIKGIRVGVSGGAGGTSVLAADQCEAAGLDVIPIPNDLRQELKRRGVSVWDWIGNPVDYSIRENEDLSYADMVEILAKNQNFDLIMVVFGEPHHEHQKNTNADDYLRQYSMENCKPKPALAIVPERSTGLDHYDDWNWKIIYELRSKLLSAGIPYYPTVKRAGVAAKKTADYWRYRNLPS
ncbi:MAG: CoA-binding protein [Deltaproteobacteria bacterium]|nr:CoA-binding protein [Deltaproteobacteria bacterium]